MNRSIQALLFLSVALSCASALDCNFEFRRSSDGNFTYILPDQDFVILNPTGSNWTAFTKIGDHLKVINQNGTTLNDVSGEENIKNVLNSYNVNVESIGFNMSVSGGKVQVHSTDGQSYLLNASTTGETYLSGSNGELMMLNLNQNSQGMRHILVQNKTIVTMFDEKCQPKTVPFNQLSSELQNMIKQRQQAMSSGQQPGGFRPRPPGPGPHPRPPGPPGPRPGPRPGPPGPPGPRPGPPGPRPGPPGPPGPRPGPPGPPGRQNSTESSTNQHTQTSTQAYNEQREARSGETSTPMNESQ